MHGESSTNDLLWSITRGVGPLIATAIHDGHELRPEVAEGLEIGKADRLREEDPQTGRWTSVAGTRIVARRSRFEVDLNRPRERAVYLEPEDAWGLTVWKKPPSKQVVERSLAEYDAFYGEVAGLLADWEQRSEAFVLLDLHPYNHRRSGPDGPPADPAENPEVNVGTGTLDRQRWGPLVDRFMGDLHDFDFRGGHLDVRENVKFRGGNFSRWILERFPATGCVLAVEFKKIYMDEWTGEPDPSGVSLIERALQSTVPGILEALIELKGTG